MTGIERLRRLARSQNMDNAWTAMLAHELCDIADQIERERECERDTIENLRLELGEARDEAAWVREHGGLDLVKAEWRSRVPYDRYERRRQRLLGHIAECETALGRRNERIEELGGRVNDLTNENAELRKRAMPEGYEWPRYESGASVGFGDDVSRHGEDFEANVIALYRDGSFSLNFWLYSKGERVKRAKRPAVPAADGEPLEAGQTVWKLYPHVERVVVKDIYRAGGTTVVEYQSDGVSYPEHCHPSDLTHTKPEPIDTWERIEEDARGLDSGVDRELFTHTHEDLVRRCRALAERGQ